MLDKTEDISLATANWLGQFESALRNSDSEALQALVQRASYWRDVLALSWRMQTLNGADAILEQLPAHARRAAPTGFAVEPDRAAPRWVTRAGTTAIEAIFGFETREGRGSGIVRLIPDADDAGRLKAWTLLTALD